MFKNAGLVALGWSLLVFTEPASAQTTAAAISGTVLDETRAALPGATVTIRQIETDATRAVVTDAAGRYQALALEPGRYSVVVELTGFQTSVREGILLSLGQHAIVNVSLTLGAVDERIVVTENVPLWRRPGAASRDGWSRSKSAICR